jgi:hypothetical protein
MLSGFAGSKHSEGSLPMQAEAQVSVPIEQLPLLLAVRRALLACEQGLRSIGPRDGEVVELLTSAQNKLTVCEMIIRGEW